MKLKHYAAASVALAFAISALIVSPASALDFNRNRIIDDSIFDNVSTMNAGQIDSFLNTFPTSCISTNSGFLAKKPIGFSPGGGYQFGGYGTAGEVIAMAGQAYGLNPQVLLATLQKEQSLVIGGANYCNNGDQHKYAAATGYGCPDSGTTYNYSGLSLYQRNGVVISNTGTTCVNSSAKAGFSQQVIRAAWLLKFGQQRAKGNVSWAIVKDGWDNSDDPQSCYGGPMTQGTWQRCPSGSGAFYDGYTTIDATATHMDTGATAALYWYTPHFHGNQSFYNLFTGWFGTSTTSGFEWKPVSQALYTDETKSTVQDPNALITGQRYFATITVKNDGLQTWKRGLVNLATVNPQNRSSNLYDSGWQSGNRAATIDQDDIQPGQNTSFSFWIKAGKVGAYKEYFSLVADGYSWMTDYGQYFDVNVAPRQYNWQYQGQAAYTDQTKSTLADLNAVVPGQRYYLTMQLKNTGNVAWRKNAINLGTAGPYGRNSSFNDGSWLKQDRAATLEQDTVNPGQSGNFSFWARIPFNQGGALKEYFNPVADGISWFQDYGLHWQFNTPQPSYSWQYLNQGIYSDDTASVAVDSANLTPNTRYYLKLQIKNNGNVIWRKGLVNLGTAAAYNRISSFNDGSWPSGNRAAYTIQDATPPGETATYGFWIKTPAAKTTYKEYFNPVADGVTRLDDYGIYWQLTVK